MSGAIEMLLKLDGNWKELEQDIRYIVPSCWISGASIAAELDLQLTVGLQSVLMIYGGGVEVRSDWNIILDSVQHEQFAY